MRGRAGKEARRALAGARCAAPGAPRAVSLPPRAPVKRACTCAAQRGVNGNARCGPGLPTRTQSARMRAPRWAAAAERTDSACLARPRRDAAPHALCVPRTRRDGHAALLLDLPPCILRRLPDDVVAGCSGQRGLALPRLHGYLQRPRGRKPADGAGAGLRQVPGAQAGRRRAWPVRRPSARKTRLRGRRSQASGSVITSPAPRTGTVRAASVRDWTSWPGPPPPPRRAS